MQFRAFLIRCGTRPLILVMLGLCSCGSGLQSLPLSALGSAATAIYSIDTVNHRVLRYVPDEYGTATLDSSINLPAALTPTLVTTDVAGNLYVGGYTTSADHSEVLVYEADAADDDAPVRTLNLNAGKLVALAVDRQSEIYTAQKNSRVAIAIYSGITVNSSPVRIIEATSFVDLKDMAVDSAGDVYISGSNGNASLIGEYSSTATGAAKPLRTLMAPHDSTFGGLAVDDDGNIFVMQDLTICKLPAGATGTLQPVQAINLPARFAGYSDEAPSNILRRDGIGDFFVPVIMSGSNGGLNVVYGFASNAHGDAPPILQFIAEDVTATGPHGANIPLAVF